VRARCELCGGRIFSNETPLQHEFSGRCSAHQSFGAQPLEAVLAPRSENPRRVQRPRAQRTGERRTRNTKPPEHGTPSRYNSTKWLCRCPLCQKANADYKRSLYDRDREARRAYNREWMRRQREGAR